MLKNTFIIIISALVYLFSTTSWASCAFDNQPGYITSTKSLVMPISRTISVPPDTPVGKEIFRLKIDITDQTPLAVKCTSKGQFYSSYGYLYTPLLPSYSSTVYNTGLEGIGVKFVQGNDVNDFPAMIPSSECSNTSCSMLNGWSADSRIVFVKTAGTITAGTIQASNLPSAIYSYGQSGSMVDVYKIILDGSLQITTPTCNITPANQAMTISMGNYSTMDFTGTGSATAWKNASIVLTNCDQFYGNITSGFTGGTFNGSTTTSPSTINNFLTVKLTPRNGTASATDAANGIMKIDDEALSATGVGIQLSSSESTSGLINLATGITQTLPKDGTRNITVPLYARYIQTENSISTGKLNGRLEYTITYQ